MFEDDFNFVFQLRIFHDLFNEGGVSAFTKGTLIIAEFNQRNRRIRITHNVALANGQIIGLRLFCLLLSGRGGRRADRDAITDCNIYVAKGDDGAAKMD